MSRPQTRIALLMEHIRAQIAARTLLPGARLPSVRQQAGLAGVSVSTVVEAYERLAAENLIVSRPGAGFFVSGPVAPLDLTRMAAGVDRAIDPLWISRQSLDADDRVLKPGCGWLPESWMYEEGMRRALRRAARASTPLLTDYGTPAGHPGLRHLLLRRMALAGIHATPAQIMLTESGTQAIDLICRFLLQPGECVLVDDPCYFNFHALLRAHRVKVIGVPYTATGPDLAAFEEALHLHSPRLYITNAGIQNPTGATLSPATAHRLLKMAEASDLVIVEDDIFADFERQPAPRLAAFDGLSRVIQIGSFSKSISASVRCGYIAARPDWIDSLIDLKIATSFGGGGLAAEIVLATLTDSGYRRHMESVRGRLAVAMQATLGQLAQVGITPWHTPHAGMFLWCRLPAGAEATAVSHACLEQGIILAPGNAFSQSGTAGDFLRFNVSRSTDPKLITVLKGVLAGV
ncbi:PLP-dependent aminotransferase family protein [Nissabacter sp. SGAir0207]|uniref:aminotransferase-like domain-containing protein n=1 Tax=Nissabacter sp. SGAir0207 TaxID=2126321 RepID=UPI0010CCC010|nr:PLP-dependent aminotransferase family protein [Nissabacter sp. SGAir0207]QCR38145.1 GntR family transcriptional regulator [Nissabacter sp. SGAir0207]